MTTIIRKTSDEGGPQPLQLTVPEHLLVRLQAYCDACGENPNDVLHDALADHLDFIESLAGELDPPTSGRMQ